MSNQRCSETTGLRFFWGLIFIVLFNLSHLLCEARRAEDCGELLCGPRQAIEGPCGEPRSPCRPGETFRPGNMPPHWNCYEAIGWNHETVSGRCPDGSQKTYCCISYEEGWCCSSTPRKGCVMHLNPDGTYVGRCVETPEPDAKPCETDADCEVKKCVSRPGGVIKCDKSGGYGRPCITDAECQQEFCNFAVDASGNIISNCVAGGNTLRECESDDICAAEGCDQIFIPGTNLSVPICISGGRGSPCSRGEECDHSYCAYGYDQRGRIIGVCLRGGSSDFECRSDKDCKNLEQRCSAGGRCEIGDRGGVPCDQEADCRKKYCKRFEDGTEKCVPSYVNDVSVVSCESDRDCQGFSKLKCKERRDPKTGQRYISCSEDGTGEFCKTTEDCLGLPKRCAVGSDGSLICMKGGANDAPLCDKDADCEKYKKVCEYVDGRMQCVKNSAPEHDDHPCSSDADCRYTFCDDGQCKTRDGIRQSECRTDWDCLRHRRCVNGYCEQVIGAGQDECSDDNQCGRNKCVQGECVRVEEPGQDECTTDLDCDVGTPKDTPVETDPSLDVRPLGAKTKLSKAESVIARGSLAGKFRHDGKLNEYLNEIIRIIHESRLPFYIENNQPKSVFLSFNDLTCGMSKKLVTETFREDHENKHKVKILLVPVMLGGSVESNASSLLEYSCYLRSFGRRKNYYEQINDLFRSILREDTDLNQTISRLISQKPQQIQKFRRCMESKKDLKAVKQIAELIEKVGVRGT
ncbi:MAG: hypothetical protein NZT61_07020, partial [Deltaproteobacteria bacterium]|nr:hypothetical protein [Deltaproteobacteria bacterium]